MSNRKFTTSRAAAFWFGLVLHLALGTALYQQISDPANARNVHPERTLHATPAAAKP